MILIQFEFDALAIKSLQPSDLALRLHVSHAVTFLKTLFYGITNFGTFSYT